jgi:uncharacterized protein (DUF488 family)
MPRHGKYRLYYTGTYYSRSDEIVFYRRKILLALLEAFGGSLPKTDCQKLLFLFCFRRGKNYYDFFPHKYGNFSIVLSQDKSKLADLGFLTSHGDFCLKGDYTHLDQLDKQDRDTLHALVKEVGSLRGEGLIRKIYLEFPHYTSRSQIAEKILRREEYELVCHTWNSDETPCLFTIGYEGLSIDAYLDILVSNNIRTLVDVRKNPISMKYSFSKGKLTEYTKAAGISYIHIPDLGIPSNLRKDLNSPKAYQDLFDLYSSQILPKQKDALERIKSIINDRKRIAITCFEANHQFCHRHKVTERLENDSDFNIPIVHLSKKNLCSTNSLCKPPSHGLWD